MGKERGEGEVKEVDPSQTLQGFEWRVKEFMPYTEQDMKVFILFLFFGVQEKAIFILYLVIKSIF